MSKPKKQAIFAIGYSWMSISFSNMTDAYMVIYLSRKGISRVKTEQIKQKDILVFPFDRQHRADDHCGCLWRP
jgi:hypothetical protein